MEFGASILVRTPRNNTFLGVSPSMTKPTMACPASVSIEQRPLMLSKRLSVWLRSSKSSTLTTPMPASVLGVARAV